MTYITETWSKVARGTDFDFYVDPDLIEDDPKTVAEVALFVEGNGFRTVLEAIKGRYQDVAPCLHIERDFNSIVSSGAIAGREDRG